MELGVAKELIERPRRSGVQGEAVLSGAAYTSVYFVGMVAGVVIGDAANCFGQVDAIRSGALGIQLPQGFVGGPAGGVQLVDQVDDVVLHSLEASDGSTELDPGAAVFHRHFVHLLRPAYLIGAEQRDGAADRALQRRPSTVELTAQDSGLGDLNTVQADFRQVPGKAFQLSD